MFHLGRDCLCRREAPKLGRFTSPLCWRCSGILAGVLIGAPLLSFLPGPIVGEQLLGRVGMVLVLPAAIDVFSQMASTYRSNWLRRLVTGMLLGVGLPFLVKSFVCSFT
jgi:uncharacterized membrane protein